MDREEVKDIVAKITIALETAKATLSMVMVNQEDEPISWVLYGVKKQLEPIEEAANRLDEMTLDGKAVDA